MDRVARKWVRQMIARSPAPLPPEMVWRDMESSIGHGPLAVGRTRTVLSVIDRELADRRVAPALRALRTAATAYLKREQESLPGRGH